MHNMMRIYYLLYTIHYILYIILFIIRSTNEYIIKNENTLQL